MFKDRMREEKVNASDWDCAFCNWGDVSDKSILWYNTADNRRDIFKNCLDACRIQGP